MKMDKYLKKLANNPEALFTFKCDLWQCENSSYTYEDCYKDSLSFAEEKELNIPFDFIKSFADEVLLELSHSKGKNSRGYKYAKNLLEDLEIARGVSLGKVLRVYKKALTLK